MKSCKVEGCENPKISNRRTCAFHTQQSKNEAVRRMKDRSPEMFKSYTLKRDYGIDLMDFNVLLACQDNRCAICGADDYSERSNNNGSKRLSVDHDHRTGAVRGLLCSQCNKGIGSLLDSPELLRKAADYLENVVSLEVKRKMVIDLLLKR